MEAAIRDDGLDFGLFAPECRLDRDAAETVIDTLRQEMTAFVTDSRSDVEG